MKIEILKYKIILVYFYLFYFKSKVSNIMILIKCSCEHNACYFKHLQYKKVGMGKEIFMLRNFDSCKENYFIHILKMLNTYYTVKGSYRKSTTNIITLII